MSYFDDWNKKIAADGEQGGLNDYARHYYELETLAYKRILQEYPEGRWQGQAAELAERLGFDGEIDIFLGFLDGIQSSLEQPFALDEVVDETPIDLSINYEKLYWNMHAASAKWLYELEEWDKVFTLEQRAAMTKAFNREHIAVSNKVGRNDPCGCGSGKKFKHCCGKRA